MTEQLVINTKLFKKAKEVTRKLIKAQEDALLEWLNNPVNDFMLRAANETYNNTIIYLQKLEEAIKNITLAEEYLDSL